MRIGKCSLSVQCLFRDFAIRYNNKWGKQMKTNYFGTLGCLAFVAIVTVCTVEPAFSQQDEGVQAILDAQADSAPLPVPVADDAQAALSDWVASKGWIEGWDSKKNRMILIQEVSGRIRPEEKNFLLKRAALYQEAELRLKARIIESFLTEVDASVIIDVPGNPLARQMEAITAEYEDSLQQARYTVEDAKEDYTDILEASDLAIADDLAGVTLQDRLNAILDGIAKKLDENYNSEDIAAEKRRRADELRAKVEEAKQNVRRAQSLEAEIQKKASKELKAVRGEYAKSQETSVKTFSQMPLLGAVVLKSAEAYDGRRDYRVAAAMAWSPKLQKEAAEILLGTGKNKPRPNKGTFQQWIASLDLSDMIGTRRYLAADGSVNFVGFAAAEYDPNNVGRESEIRAFASQQAKGMAVLSMKSDVEVARIAETKNFAVDGADGREDFSFANMSENMVQTTDGAVSISGLISPSPKRTVHKPSGKPIFVAYAYVNSDVAAKSQAFREETYALKRWINEDQAERLGNEAGMRAAAEEKKVDRATYNEGYVEGQEGVRETDAANQAAAIPMVREETPQPAAAEPQRAIDEEAEAGMFVDDSDVDDDF
jgi:hypothetical protein